MDKIYAYDVQKTDPQETYKVFNEKYFGNKLSKHPTILWDAKETAEMVSLALSHMEDDRGTCKKPLIIMTPRMAFAENLWHPALLHEMCHIYMRCVTKEYDGFWGNHSDQFNLNLRKLLHQLIDSGAYDQ